MPRIRSIKPEFWGDFPTAQLSRDARLLYIALWNFADEHGRMAGDPRFVKGQVFPYDDDLSADAVDVLLDELDDAGRVVRYNHQGAPYLHLPKLATHQRLEPGKVPSRLPTPPDPDGSARRADKSAPDSDSQPVENPETGSETTNPQVSDPPQVRDDSSARGADESSLLYVAGSRLQVAGSRAAAAAPAEPSDEPRADESAPRADLPPAVAILRSKLNARRLTVRWDKLTPEQLTQIETLVELHGDGPLVKKALDTFQPDNPPVFAQAWLSHWLAIPTPGTGLHLVDPLCPTHTFQREPAATCKLCASERLAGDAR